MNYEIPIPNDKPEWKIGPNDSVTFNFTEDVTHFEVVSHPDYFTPDVPSGGFMNDNFIGPYTANVKGKKVVFEYTLGKEQDVDSHTILIGS